jgi:hypothetical protein
LIKEPISSQVCELCNPRDSHAMRALESLTPNGSEFVNDPDRCVAFVRERLDFNIQLAKERNAWRSLVTTVTALVNKPFVSEDKAERFDEMETILKDIKEALCTH